MTEILHGQIAQSVEQRTENPRVGGSIPSLTTSKPFEKSRGFLFQTKSKISTDIHKVETKKVETNSQMM